MRIVYIICICLTLGSCSSYQKVPQKQIEDLINNWHEAAANADFATYFNLMSTDAVFIGTDATENWPIEEFKAFAKPYFDAGKAWSFTPLERHVYYNNNTVYFDELLSTQMGICRGSGVIVIENNQPRIAHYVLSIAVPNEYVSSLTDLKKEWDDDYIEVLRSQ